MPFSIALSNEELVSRRGEDMVTIITVTNRQRFMDNVFSNYKRQRIAAKELIIIINNDDIDIKKWHSAAKRLKNVTIFRLPSKITLGECCNYAISKAKYGIIAKFDDDDYYSSRYLLEDTKAFKDPKVQLVGKREHFVYFKNSSQLGLRKTHKNSPLPGATLIFRKKALKKVKFRSLNEAEDVMLTRDFKNKGYKIRYSNHYNYVCIRYENSHHTWKINDEELIRYCKNIRKTKSFKPFVKSKK